MDTMVIELLKNARRPLELNARPGQELLIVSDSQTERAVYEAFAAAAYDMGLEPNIMIMTARQMHGHEPTKTVAHAMKNTDVLIAAASTALTHTDAVRAALMAGVTYISMPGISVDLLTKGGATADYDEVGRITHNIAEVLRKSQKSVRITTEKGTDLTMSVTGRPILELAGVYKQGAIACFPDGEVACAPVEGTCEGRLVVDLHMHSVGHIKKDIVLTVEKGRVVKIEGGDQAEQLKEIWMTSGDENSGNIAELALGTNPQSRLTGHVSEIKKKLGLVHIGIGDNRSLGGTVFSKTHMDAVIKNPTVIVDDTVVFENGKALIR
ncbi:MAG: aminopeptidase [Desulfocucumaceae bacterium]